jgi:hypothetical protein
MKYIDTLMDRTCWSLHVTKLPSTYYIFLYVTNDIKIIHCLYNNQVCNDANTDTKENDGKNHVFIRLLVIRGN